MSAPSFVPGREFELKFELPGAEIQRLGEVERLKAASGDNHRKMLRSIYFDTPDHDLHKARIALRLRNDGGKTWLQTVKTGAVINGVSDVGQFEALLDRCSPDLNRVGDKRLRRKMKKIRRNKPLAPVFETIVDRTTRMIEKEDCTAELALDEGRVEANGLSREISEAELELCSGSVEGLLAIAREVFAGFSVRPSESSKAALGYALLHPAKISDGPPHAAPIALRSSDRADDAFAAILQSASRHIIANERIVLERGDVEAIHQMRVGLTRLRSALRSIRPYADARWIRELESDAQNAARTVGVLRDADVLIAEIYTPIAEQNSAVPGFPGLLEALNAHRAAAYKEVVDNLRAGAWPRLLVTMLLGPLLLKTGGGLDEPIKKVASESLMRCWKKVSSYGERIDALDLEERHSMRKALKKLRYNCEFFQTLYGRKAQDFVKRLKTLQDLFGAINDARLAERLAGIALERATDTKALIAAGYIMGRHEADVPHVWSKAKGEWKRLEKAAGFWC